MNIDLIIFDCDGVLVDSEVISCRVHAEVLTRNGYPISTEQVYDRFLGRSARQATQDVEAELGRPLPADFDTQLRETIYRTFRESLAPIPHIHAALERITQPVCVASSGSHERMRVSLGCAGLYERFAPHIFSSSEVRNGKPAPDLFLHASARMGIMPARCVVIEDSLSGVRGAVAAGMTAFGFCGGSHCRPDQALTLRQAGAAITFDDMRQLPELIAGIGQSTSPAAAI